MKKNNINKKYIYIRDLQKCYYCNKPLKLSQTTLDHYFPKALGGTDEYFNLVTCCKRCNKIKGRNIPNDLAFVQLDLLNKAVNHSKIISIIQNVNQKNIINLTKHINHVVCNYDHSTLRGEDFTLYSKNNKIYMLDGRAIDYMEER